MIKMLKWAYNKGVQHERLRIKKLIAEFDRDLKNDFDHMEGRIGPDPKKRDLERETRKMEARSEANRILMRLIEPGYEYGQMVTHPSPIDNDGGKHA